MILLVDDDPSVTASLSLLLKRGGHQTVSAADPEEALVKAADRQVELVVQDMNFGLGTSGEEGLELLEGLRRLRPELPVILLTAWGSISLAVEGMKRGASDFITKPWSNAQVAAAVDTALSLARATDEPPRPMSRRALDQVVEAPEILGEDPRLLKVLQLLARVAPTDASVLITGETGTGKELAAQALHRNSRRREQPFVKVNLGGLSSTLFESEMFGHVRGAFTDAKERRRGRFEVAHGGTIFLDEIGEIDLNTQVKLLRVLQDRTYEVLGSSQTRSVDVRILSATNRPLAEMVSAGEFREDLLYRLNLITLHLPPLRERRSDIPLLARHFLDACAAAYARPPLGLEDDAVAWLRRQPWPGNIRQLRQVMERAVLIHDRESLRARDLETVVEIDLPGRPPGKLPEVGSMTLEEMERAMIEKSLRHYQGNITRVAEALGLSRAALYRRFEKYGLDPSRS